MSGERVGSLTSNDPASGPPAAAPSPAGRQLVDVRLVALTPDRGHLILEDSEAQQYRLVVDHRLATALRASAPRDPARTGQLEIALESSLRPREIQARIRAGHGVDEVAREAGISAERVERYAGPVMAERTHVVEQAQRAPGRRATGGSAPMLLDLVHSRLAGENAPADSIEWDAWRGATEELWTVRLSYLANGRARSATWTFDPRGRVLTPADDEARWLVGDPGVERSEDDSGTVVRRLSSVPSSEEAAAAARADEVYDREADEAREAAARQAAAEATSPRHGRRPVVPSWDDIVFGPRRRG